MKENIIHVYKLWKWTITTDNQFMKDDIELAKRYILSNSYFGYRMCKKRIHKEINAIKLDKFNILEFLYTKL